MISRRTALRVETLEGRALPSVTLPATGNPAGMVSTSDLIGRNSGDLLALPDGWTQWSNSDVDLFAGSAPAAPGGNAGGITATYLASSLQGRAWQSTARPADVSVSADILLDTLHPAQVLARGRDLATGAPDYVAVQVTRGMNVQLVKVVNGVTTVLADLDSASYFSGQWVRVTLRARGSQLEADVQRLDTNQYLDTAGKWVANSTTALKATDSSAIGGSIGLARPARYAGTLYFANVSVTNLPPSTETPPVEDDETESPTPTPGVPNIPQHHDWIRLAALAYAGTPMDAYAQELLRNHLDLVVANPTLLGTINSVAPNTPQMVYSNVTNIYLNLLTDWLNYADRKGIDREAAFFHVSKETAFSGNSPSSQPVSWFWNVLRGPSSGAGTWAGLTTAAARSSDGEVFGSAGQSLYLAYPDRFRELNVNLRTPAGSGWTGVLEYVSATDAAGNPTAWKTLSLVGDTTAGFTRSGRVSWNVPSDWKSAVVNGSARQFYVRVRTTSTGGTPPVANTITGRDYTQAGNGTVGTIPAFDHTADADGDGHLSETEYARRRSGFDARFEYESRLFQPGYGQMRFSTNPAGTGVADWAGDYLKRFLASQPIADGVFLDNSSGRSPTREVSVLEPASDYATDLAAMLKKVSAVIAPDWILANSAGNYAETDRVFASVAAGMEEFSIRAMKHTFSQFEDIAKLVDRRLQAGNYLILDSLAAGGDPTDGRTQLATLAYYYLLADPEQTFLMFYGGNEPSTHWSRHYSEAVEVDVGDPTGKWSVRLTGQDPANTKLTYRVIQRQYENALVLYKPISHALGVGQGTSADNTATVVQLDGLYRPVRADGTLGAAVRSISLRNAEGAILVKA